jgi:hypothetical protein
VFLSKHGKVLGQQFAEDACTFFGVEGISRPGLRPIIISFWPMYLTRGEPPSDQQQHLQIPEIIRAPDTTSALRVLLKGRLSIKFPYCYHVPLNDNGNSSGFNSPTSARGSSLLCLHIHNSSWIRTRTLTEL